VPSSISRRARLTASWRATKLVSASFSAAALIAGCAIAFCHSWTLSKTITLSKRKVRTLNAGANGTRFAEVFLLFMTRKFR
jgi:hypothetical protein